MEKRLKKADKVLYRHDAEYRGLRDEKEKVAKAGDLREQGQILATAMQSTFETAMAAVQVQPSSESLVVEGGEEDFSPLIPHLATCGKVCAPLLLPPIHMWCRWRQLSLHQEEDSLRIPVPLCVSWMHTLPRRPQDSA